MVTQSISEERQKIISSSETKCSTPGSSAASTATESTATWSPSSNDCCDGVVSSKISVPSARYVKANSRCPERYYSAEEVAKHNTANDCWVIVDGMVYDVTAWIKRHPGGEFIILSVAGMDITDAFLVNHLPFVREKILPLYQIGYVRNYEVTTISKSFCELASHIESNGWYETDYWYYIKMTLWYTVLFAAAMACVLRGTNPIVRVVLGGLLMATFWQQLAFAGHDLGHMAVTHNRLVDNIIGVVGGNFFMGIAIGWWKATHNVHHLVTNYLEYDPDIQHLPVLAISRKFFDGPWSYFHNRRMDFDRIARFFIARQHWLYYPIMAVARFNLYLQSIFLLIWKQHAIARGVTFPRLELLMLGGFYIWLGLLCSKFPTWAETFSFIFLSHGAAGLLHVQICISHFPMEVLDSRVEKPLEKTDYATQQLLTCLDVDCPKWLDWFHGGLQFQTSHHLFPLMPRHRLRDSVPYVQNFADEHGLEYFHVPFLEANKKVVRGLKQTADGIHPWLIQLLNAEG